MITLGIARPASAAALLLSCAAACLAQSTTAQITGRISDQSGALVPAAAITVANVNTGITSSTESNELGNYSVPLLPPGTYRITAQKEGFKPRTQTGVELQVNQTARVDFVMELGTLAEAVEVVAAAPLLAQQTSSLGQVVDNTKIVNMPLNGRSPFRLVQLTPGVLSSPAASGQFGDVAVNTNQDSDFSINGGQAHHAEVQIDGVPATAGFNDSLTTIPSVDATQEFKVESNNLSAEWGRFSGGVVNVSTRSGTNDLHGSLYEFLRNSALDANAFFNNRAGQQKPPFRMNQFGFAAGGPVWLGRLYNGRNRTFFFADYQGTRWRRGDVFITTLPAELERAGNFTQSFDQQRRMIRIYDPLTTRLDPNRPGQYIRDPFPGNVIPSSRIDPVAQKISTYYPTPNTPGDPVTHVNNFVSNASRLIDKTDLGIRIDHNFSERFRLFGRVGIANTDLAQPDVFGNPASGGPGNVGTTVFHNRTGVLDQTTILSPTSILGIRYGFARWFQGRTTRSYGFDQRTLGFPEALVSQFQLPLFPAISVQGFSGMAGNSYYFNGNDKHTLLASFTRISGRHNLKIGSDIRLHRINLVSITAGGGSYSFNRNFTRGPDPNRSTTDAGSGFASLLLGVPASGSANTTAGVSLQNWYFAGYIQDDIRVSSRLTLNLGLRFETETPYTERRNQLVWFDPAIQSPAANSQFPALTGGLRFAGPDSRYVYDWDKNNVAPRFGFAYTVTPKTVFRAGAGLFYSALEVSPDRTGFSPSWGFSATTPFVGSLDGLTPIRYLRNPFPDGLVQPTRDSLGAATFLGQNLRVWDRHARTPYAAQWNANLQQQLPGEILIDVAYSANRGIKLARERNLNALAPEHLELGTGLQRTVDNPFASKIPSGVLSQPRVATQRLLVPYPQFTGVTVENSTSGNSIYHSMQLKVEKRYRQGVSFLLSYTAGKTISDTLKALTDFGSYVQSPNVQNWYDLRSERSLSEFDVSRSLALSYVLDLPIGPGKRFVNSTRGLPARLLEGWRVGGITTYQTGVPLALTTTVAGIGNRPNSTGSSAEITADRSRGEAISRWFDTSAFTQPPPFSLGNVSRTLPDVRAPSYTNLDLSLMKDTRLNEQMQLQFRAEAFNLRNTPSLWKPNTSFDSLQFGQISQTFALPRVLQFSLKLLF
ncbi:MAG: carboxypeptidase regulatory-like domain-containing protein [Acidobacteria bacterium]|nr:carboxypeptidase regulatory-like domain-containing protein [Acidobacteriota bacterium]